jgi:hypothetical protein
MTTETTIKIQLGTIFCDSWGYDQTNVDFYEVTKIISDKTFEITAISCQRLEENEEKVIPVSQAYHGEPMRKRLNKYGGISLPYGSARLWDGKPKYCTAFGNGH